MTLLEPSARPRFVLRAGCAFTVHGIVSASAAPPPAQLINLLTTKELNLALPKKPLKPCTFLLKPGQCLLLGGLARLDYADVGHTH